MGAPALVAAFAQVASVAIQSKNSSKRERKAIQRGEDAELAAKEAELAARVNKGRAKDLVRRQRRPGADAVGRGTSAGTRTGAAAVSQGAAEELGA
jgi:signal transduction histidine kinase